MPSGYKVGSTDLDAIFKARISTKRADVGFDVGGTDISNRYEKATSSAQWIASNTGFVSAGTDLRELFMDIDYPLGPTITDQPDAGTYDEGDSMTLSVTATSSGGTLHYQWQRDVGSGWTNVGSDSSSYTINPLDRADQGDYRCVVSDDNGDTTSSEVAITVNYPPSITSDPTGGTLNSGDAASFAVTASAGQPAGITYQWYRDGVAINSGTDGGGKFAGYNTNNLTFLCDYRDHNKNFMCRVSNSAGYDDSANALLLVNYQPIITDQPDSFALNETESGSFSVTAHGYPSPTYQWQKNISGTWTNLTGQTSATLPRNSVALSNAGDYRCQITNSQGTTTSSTATLTVYDDPDITTNPSNQTVNDGDAVGFQCEATGDGTLYFEWFENDGGGWVSLNSPRTGNVSGTHDQHVINPATVSMDGYQYRCRVTNSHGGPSETSTTATLTVNP